MENINHSYLTAMHTDIKPSASDTSVSPSYRGSHGYNSYDNGGYRSFNRIKGSDRFIPIQISQFHAKSHALPFKSSGVLGTSPTPICQLCNIVGHTAPFYESKHQERFRCNICGKTNHTT